MPGRTDRAVSLSAQPVGPADMFIQAPVAAAETAERAIGSHGTASGTQRPRPVESGSNPGLKSFSAFKLGWGRRVEPSLLRESLCDS